MLTFYRPVYQSPTSPQPAKPRNNLRYRYTDDIQNNIQYDRKQLGNYDLLGRPVDTRHMHRGVYILNGKKVVVK